MTAAQLLGNTLYMKRLFPYYTFIVLVGLNTEGKGAMYLYDVIRLFKQTPFLTSRYS